MKYQIITAESEIDFDKAKKIILAYAKFLNVDLSFQNFDHELENLSVMYGKPKGCMLLVEYSGVVVGAVGLRYLSDGIAEMKRMFVLPEYQGLGLGDALMSRFIEVARQLGYLSITLDTVPELNKAVCLYKKYGFVPVAPYRYNPHAEALFYGLSLKSL